MKEQKIQELNLLKKCDDLESNTFVLPSGLQHTGNKAFLDVKLLKQLDLTNLDHVIKIDADLFIETGCLHNTKINTILVKDQAMEEQQSNDKYLSSVIDYIYVE